MASARRPSLDGAAVLRARLARDDPAATRVSGSDPAAARTRRPLDPATTVAIAFVITGWAIYLLLGPLALFLTWYGDCLADPCPSPSRIDEATYVFDVLWWVAVPGADLFRLPRAALGVGSAARDRGRPRPADRRRRGRRPRVLRVLVHAAGSGGPDFRGGAGSRDDAAPSPRPGGRRDGRPAGLDRLPRGRGRGRRASGPARRPQRADPRGADPHGDRDVRHRGRGFRQP